MKKLLFSWNELSSTFWFIPVVIIFFTLIISFVLIYIDSITDFTPGTTVIYLLTGSVDSARSVLSVISGAMIGVAGTVFSITLVVLSLASSQFGSRLLKNFMYDKINQIVLGSYISTFLYCLIILNSIQGSDDFTFIPTFSVLFALVAAVANIILLIIFIHHIAVSIQADNVISNISESLWRNIKNLLPESVGEEKESDGNDDKLVMISELTYRNLIKSGRSGYVQYLDGDAFFKFAVDKNGLAELFFRPGDYLVEGMDIGYFYTRDKLEEDELARFKSFFLTGKVRTIHQDTEFSIHQMVEIAARALSPGINDPYTAISCIDNLTSTMCYLSGVKFPSRYRYDNKGKLRLIARTLTFEGIMDASFNQIRQFGHSVPSVALRLMDAFIVIEKFAVTREQKEAVKKHAQMVIGMAESSFKDPNDLKDLKERSKVIREEG